MKPPRVLGQLPIGQRAIRPYVCPRCMHREQRRQVSTSYLERKQIGRELWDIKAQEIRAGTRKSMLSILEERGFVHQIAGERSVLDEVLTDKRCGIYCGIDPTASSLHVGHLLPFMALFWMYLHGYHTVSLIGGATAKIGDPTGRTTDRREMTKTERKANMLAIHYQLKKLWLSVEKIGAKHGYIWDKHWHRDIANNNIWWNKVPFADVLRYLGRGLRLGPMLSRDTVKTKMESGDGISFAEFCYPIMQSWDWWELYTQKDIQLQIGGADQYGNLVAGVESVKWMAKSHPHPDVGQPEGVVKHTSPYAFTVPLLTTAAGEKFGKSAGNAIWLDRDQTSPFDLYGFFVRTADADVEKYLKLFTFLPLTKISDLMELHKQDPKKREAQHALAFEFLSLIHGEEEAVQTRNKHQALFSRDPTAILTQTTTTTPASPESPDSLLPTSLQNFTAGNGVSTVVVPLCLIENRPIAQVLYSVGLAPSRSEGHRLTQNRGVYIGKRVGGDAEMRDAVEYIRAGLANPSQTMDNLIVDDPSTAKPGHVGLLILRTGKWRIRMVQVVTDAHFATLLSDGNAPEPPGYQEALSGQALERSQDRRTLRDLARMESELLAQRDELRGDAELLGTQPAEGDDVAYPDEERPGRRAREANRHASARRGFEELQHEVDGEGYRERVRRMTAEFGADRRAWPPEPPRIARERVARDKYAVQPRKVPEEEKARLHRAKTAELKTVRERDTLRSVEKKLEDMRMLREELARDRAEELREERRGDRERASGAK